MTCWEIQNVALFFSPSWCHVNVGHILTNWLIYLSFTDMGLYEWNLNINFKKQVFFNMSQMPQGKLLFSFPFSLPWAWSTFNILFQLLSNTKHHTLSFSPISNSTQSLTTLFMKYFTIQIPSTNYHLNPSYHQAICMIVC